jgi:hypothetical protein
MEGYMPTRQEVDTCFREAFENYHTILQEFYTQETGANRIDDLLTPNFNQNHTVLGGQLNKNNATDIARRRSNGFVMSFVSTIVPKDMVLAICRHFRDQGNKTFLKTHILLRRFNNYPVPIAGTIIVVRVNTIKKMAQISQGRGAIEVGLNQQGFINHLQQTTLNII